VNAIGASFTKSGSPFCSTGWQAEPNLMLCSCADSGAVGTFENEALPNQTERWTLSKHQLLKPGRLRTDLPRSWVLTATRFRCISRTFKDATLSLVRSTSTTPSTRRAYTLTQPHRIYKLELLTYNKAIVDLRSTKIPVCSWTEMIFCENG